MKKEFILIVAVAVICFTASGELSHSGLAKQARKTCAKDFTPERADGRTMKTMAWARKKYADVAKKPAHPFLKDRESFLAWKADYLKKYASYLPWKTKGPAVEFVSKEKRDGFTLCVYECHPYPRAAVRAWVLVPDDAKQGQTPVVFCLPGSGASLEGLVGDKDPYFTRYPIRNRQAWWYAKAGMIAVALPGCANGAPDDLKSAHSRSRYLSYLQDTGWTDAKLIELERCMCQDFLKGRTDFSN